MLAIIGGTGIYNIEGLQVVEEVEVETPFGAPSAAVVKAAYKDKELLFLPRHGVNHQFLPHEINYRANIFALKKLGAKQLLGFSATGSLREDIHPGELAIPSQYFDFIKGGRARTFFGDGVAAHISTAEPTCKNLTQWVADKADATGLKLHTGKTYACVDGAIQPALWPAQWQFFLALQTPPLHLNSQRSVRLLAHTRWPAAQLGSDDAWTNGK